MIFHALTIHGTHIERPLTDVRYSIEVRLCAQEHALDQPAIRIQKLYRFQQDDYLPIGVPQSPPWHGATN